MYHQAGYTTMYAGKYLNQVFINEGGNDYDDNGGFGEKYRVVRKDRARKYQKWFNPMIIFNSLHMEGSGSGGKRKLFK